MKSLKSMGRLVGLLLLMQFIGGVLVNMVLVSPLFSPPGFLVNGAGHAQQIGLSVLVGLLNGLLGLALAITMFPAFRGHSKTPALWLVALASVGLAVTAGEQISVLSMVSLSQAYTDTGVANQELLESVGVIVSSRRNWSHYLGLIFSGFTFFAFYTALFKTKMVPRVLAGFGLVGVVLQIITVSMPLLGGEVNFQMFLPIALAQIATISWLLAKGFGANQMNRMTAAVD